MENQNCFYRISVKALIYDENWKILLCKEDTWKWDLPWWWLDHGETYIDCLKRELFEEMWLEIIKINKDPKYFVTANKPQSKTRPWIANICYEVEVKNFDFNKSDECEEIWFFDFDEMKNLDLLPNVIELINNI